MTVSLLTMLAQEQAVFAHFSVSTALTDSLTAFATPGSNQEAHWNLVYPSARKDFYTDVELEKARNFFRHHGTVGHLILFDPKWRDISVEESEYFYARAGETFAPTTESDLEGFGIVSGFDLKTFSETVAGAFGYDAVTEKLFREKMDALNQAMPSKFWIFSHGGKTCGTASTFQTPDGAEFLFNVGVLPQFRGKGFASRMLRYCLSQTRNPVYTYSENLGMKRKILPEAGMISVGSIFLVSIEDYINNI